MNYTETRDALIAAGIDPARLPDEWEWRIDLGGADLSGANLGGAYLSGANLGGAYLRGANLGGANLGGATINWNSHDLLAEIVRRAAGDDLRQRMTAGLILISDDWCWDKFVAVFGDDTKNWLGSVFAPYVKDDDGAPKVVRQYKSEVAS